MINSADFVKRLEKILEFYQLTATAFAEVVDFNRSTISHLLSGRNKPSLEFVIVLLEKFPEVKMDWLLFGKGIFPAPDVKKMPEHSPQKNSKTYTQNSREFLSDGKKVAGIKNVAENELKKREVEKIIIFYRDGGFNIYEN